MNKRGQGLSLDVIIVAALALIVLVVLIAIFTGRISVFSGEVGGAEMDAKIKAENIAKTTCEGTCFSTLKWNSATQKTTPAQQILVKGSKREGRCESTTETQIRQTFTDVESGYVCCIPAKPTSASAGC